MNPTHRGNSPWLGKFVELGPADFVMGAAAEDRFVTTGEQSCKARLAAFALGDFPLTTGQWEFRSTGGLPKVRVSLQDIEAWLGIAREKSGIPLRLPSEAEWEFAARAGGSGGFPNGEIITPAEANFLHDDARNRVGPGCLTPRDTYPPNIFGLQDMLGNVAEWTAGGWVRSAGWDALPRLLRFSARHPLPPDRRQDNLGFRLAFDLP